MTSPAATQATSLCAFSGRQLERGVKVPLSEKWQTTCDWLASVNGSEFSLKHCLVPRPLAVFHLGQSVSDHVVRAKKRGPDKNRKLRQIVSFFPGSKAVRAMAENSVEVVSSNSFSTQMRNASIDVLLECISVLNSFSEGNEWTKRYGFIL